MKTPREHRHTAPGEPTFRPIIACTRTFYRAIDPVAFNCAKVVIVRSGGAVLFTEFATHHVNAGDVVILAENTMCGVEPEGSTTTTTLYLDWDYLVDQVFWKYADRFSSRLDAKQYLDAQCIEPAQVVQLGQNRTGILMPLLDELAALSRDGLPPTRFYRAQALLFSVLDVVIPHMTATTERVSATRRCATCPTLPRLRRFRALRQEARQAAALLYNSPEHRWTLPELADAVHLSQSQLDRVFVEAFGKTPIAYLAMLRVERMANLLRSTDRPIRAIALEVGWSDPDFAARQFRRSIGLPPSQYRAQKQRYP